MSLKLVLPNEESETMADPATETIVLSEAHIEYLERISPELNPEFGWSDAIRAILDRFEQSGIDLTAASSEEEIARLAAAQLRSNAALCASASSQSEARQEYRSSLPVTGRCRSGRLPQ